MSAASRCQPCLLTASLALSVGAFHDCWLASDNGEPLLQPAGKASTEMAAVAAADTAQFADARSRSKDGRPCFDLELDGRPEIAEQRGWPEISSAGAGTGEPFGVRLLFVKRQHTHKPAQVRQ
jgi:hypothetical protein